jgi:hypothetical protein
MGIEFAIDQLYAGGWVPGPQGSVRHTDGRLMPDLEAVRRELAAAGCALRLRHVQLFDCYQAEWRDAAGTPMGAVVGRTEAEAAVYALSRFRAQTTAVS